MSLKFRLKGLAETFLDQVSCPCCGHTGKDDQFFSTEMTRVTFDGIVVIAQCKICAEIFIPNNQRMGVISQKGLKEAVEKDLQITGETDFSTYQMAAVSVDKINAERKGELS